MDNLSCMTNCSQQDDFWQAMLRHSKEMQDDLLPGSEFVYNSMGNASSEGEDSIDELMQQVNLQSSSNAVNIAHSDLKIVPDIAKKKKSIHAHRIWKHAQKSHGPNLSFEDWQLLLDTKDTKALGLRAEYNDLCKRRTLKSRLRQKHEQNPKDVDLLSSIAGNGFTESSLYENLKQQKTYEVPMPQKKKHLIQNLICKLRKDVQEPTGGSEGKRPSTQAGRRRRGISRAFYEQYIAAKTNNDEAEEIINLLRYLRSLTRFSLQDDNAADAWIRLNAWMQLNRRNEFELIWPTTIPVSSREH